MVSGTIVHILVGITYPQIRRGTVDIEDNLVDEYHCALELLCFYPYFLSVGMWIIFLVKKARYKYRTLR